MSRQFYCSDLLQSPREEVGSGDPDKTLAAREKFSKEKILRCKTFAPHQAAHALGADLLPLSCLHPITSCLRAASRSL